MVKEKKGIWRRIHTIDRRLFFWVGFFIFALPLVFPIVLPIPISTYSTKGYEAVMATPSGSVALDFCDALSSWFVYKDLKAAWDRALLLKGVKIVNCLLNQNYEPILKSYYDQLEPWLTAHGKQYGVDYVCLPYVAGQEVAYASFSRDIRSIISHDLFGTPIDDLPLMQTVYSGADFSLLLTAGTNLSPGLEGPIRHFVGAFKTPYVVGTSGVVLGPVSNYYQTGQVKGFFLDVRGCAEGERLFGYTGQNTKSMSAVNVVSVAVITLIALGNIAYFMSKREERSLTARG